MKHLSFLLLPAWLICSTQAALGQEAAARRHIEKGLALASGGDTVLAFAELRKAVDAAPKFADAYFHIGRLYSHRASAVETDFRDRLQAEKALLEALRLSPRHPRYLLELGRLRLKQHMTVDAGRLLGRSLARAKKLGDPEILADVHFNLGYLKEMRYQSMRHRRFRPFLSGPPINRLTSPHDINLTRYTNQYLAEHGSVEGSGREDMEQMVEHYRATLRYQPGHVGAATRLMGHLLDEYRFSEYLVLARKLLAANPERPEPFLYLGLGLHAAGREDDAGKMFDEGLARLSDTDRSAIENLAPVMRKREAQEYLDLSEDARADFERRYWELTDPLFLTEANERRLEHISRVGYADLRFSAPSAGRRGWETDRGVIYIRYGPPLEIGTFGAETSDRGDPFMVGRRSIIWTYGPKGPIFTFRQMPGYLDAKFAGDYKFIAEDYRHVQPAKYDNIPSIPELHGIPVQIARFRGETPDEVAVEIHAALPLDKLARDLDMEKGELQTGMFIVNRHGDEVIRRVKTEVLAYADASEVDELRSWRVILPESDRLVAAVEARDQVSWRSAASRDTFTATLFSADTLGISDILVGDLVRPLVEEPTHRDDYDIVANPALEFGSGDQIHLYYELYGLGEDREGFASFEVALNIRVKKLYRGGVLAQVLGGLADAWGFSIVGDDRLELRFSREVRMDGRDRVIEYLQLDPREVPTGEYEVRVRVWDRINERLATRRRGFKVIDQDE